MTQENLMNPQEVDPESGRASETPAALAASAPEPAKPEGSTWTDGQWRAIVARNRNLLVAAAAGSGKTAVLVERIIRRISDESDPLDVDRLLVATFTKAAASEMRHRIGSALEEALFGRPESDHLKKQLALLNRASITTLHSFCLDVIRRYFPMIDLDPGFRIADETEADMMRQEQLEGLLEERYAGAPEDHPFWRLAEWFGGDRSDAPLLALIGRLFDASRSHPFPAQWLFRQVELFEGAAADVGDGEGSAVREEALLRNPWLASLLRDVRLELEGAGALLDEAIRLCGEPLGPAPYAVTLEEDRLSVRLLAEAGERGWAALHGAFGGLAFGKLKPVKGDSVDKELQEQVKELRKAAKDRLDKLREELFTRTPEDFMRELRDMAPLMRELAELTEEFASRYQAAKMDKGLVDFTDLEHYCLRILGEPDGAGGLRPTSAALAYREQFAEIMLDEYQDTNLVQETIVALISRPAPGNRFMVGDVKQSIYRFRLAEPGLFLEKYRSYSPGKPEAGAPGERIDLARNFRSRGQVVDGVNFLFRQIMREAVGEMEYDTDAELVCGASYPEDPSADFSSELVLIDRDRPDAEEPAGPYEDDGAEGDPGEAGISSSAEEAVDLAAAQVEARYIGRRIRSMMGLDGETPFAVSERNGSRRAPRFRDFVILLRATRNMAPVLIEELGLLGIPAYADLSSGYFAATEVETVLSLLKVIDNPRQDIPLAAVLRSPIVGLSADELARIRLADRSGSYYDALQAWLRQAEEAMRVLDGVQPLQLELWTPEAEPAYAEAAAATEGETGAGEAFRTPEGLESARRVLRFRQLLEAWRQAAREGSLSELISAIYRETGYFDYAGGLPGGAQRQANLRALYDRARQYESTSFRGLFRFLRFVERLQESGGDLGTARALGEQEDVVRIMSIHKSKGLEFPVVFVAGMGKTFNLMDMNGAFLIHKELGFGPRYMEEELRAVYPTLPQLSIRRRMRMETLAEEMRVLYVALTRAKEKLILLGAVSSLESKLRKWSRALGADSAWLPDYILAEARSYLDWVVPAAMRHPAAEALRDGAGDPAFPARRLFERESSEWTFGLLSAMAFSDQPGGSSTESETGADADSLERLAEAVRRLMPLPAAGLEGFGEELERRLNWSYPFEEASALLTKTSVSELKRLHAGRVLEASGDEPEAPLLPALEKAMNRGRPSGDTLYRQPRFRRARKLTPAEIGTLYHTVMQHVPYQEAPDGARIGLLLRELEERKILMPEERQALDPEVIAAFFRTELGRRLAGAVKVRRELPFSFGLRAGEVYPDCGPAVADETLLIQGVIDCVFEDADGRLVLLDYKTDRIGPAGEDELAERYRLQLELYGRAMESIWKRPVDETAVYYFDGARIVRY